MGCGDSGCHGPSLAYMAAADISSRTSSKEERATGVIAANRQVIEDLLRTHIESRQSQLDGLEAELKVRGNELTYLREALANLETAGEIVLPR